MCKHNFAALHHLKTWNEHISATNCPFETNQRTDLITASHRKFVLVYGTFNPYANLCPMVEKVENGVIFGAPDIQLFCLITAYAGMPCTTCVKGRVGQVWACPDASGRLYDCGKTGQNTDLLRMEYPKNSLFKLICSEWSTLITACLNLTSGPQPPQVTDIHVVKSDLSQPVANTLGTSKFTYLHMEPISM
jgi:hypothetical protein